MPPTEEEREASTLDVASQQIFAMLEAFPRFKDLAADGMRPADVAADARGCIVFTGPLKMLQVRRPRHCHCYTIPVGASLMAYLGCLTLAAQTVAMVTQAGKASTAPERFKPQP